MQVIIHGIKKTFDDFIPINDSLDKAFLRLYHSFFNDPGYSISNLTEEYLPKFEVESLKYLRSHTDYEDIKPFIRNLSLIWDYYFWGGRLEDFCFFWRRILRVITHWEKSYGFQIHKGAALYFWGVSEILRGELDFGFLLMHAAFEEDKRTTNTALPDIPAYKFVSLDFQDSRQFFRGYVRSLADYLDQFLSNYRLKIGNQLTIEEFQSKFLYNNSDTPNILAFTHALARLQKFDSNPIYVTSSDYSSQYQQNLLYDLVQVIEVAIKVRHPRYQSERLMFARLAHHLSVEKCDFKLSQNRLTDEINPLIDDVHFDLTIDNLLDGVFKFIDGYRPSEVESSVCIAYMVRNHAAHNVSSYRVIGARYRDIQQALFNVLFLTVETMY